MKFLKKINWKKLIDKAIYDVAVIVITVLWAKFVLILCDLLAK